MDDMEAVRATASRDFTTLKLWEVPWSFFQQGLSSVPDATDLFSFHFYARLSGIGKWTGLVDSSRLAVRLLSSIEEAVVEAGFMNIPAIETVIEAEAIVFRYTDTDFSFDLVFRGSGYIELRRGGSSLKTFHRWYVGLMPSMPAILLEAMAAVDSELQRSLRPDNGRQDDDMSRPGDDERSETVRVLEGGFSFEVVCSSFTQGDVRKNNLDVVRENLAVRLPDTTGKISYDVSPNIDLDKYGRIDYKVGVRHPFIPAVTQFLSVEAPSNADWSALFFRMAYVGENFLQGRGENREALNPDLFLSSAVCSDAYLSFFRDIGLAGFLESVTHGFNFKTSALGAI